MEHLPVHLAYKVRIAGPVQYRWMYSFEQYLKKLKNNVRNKARVERSICNAYLVEEASSFCSYYFEDHIPTRHRKVPRNYDGRGELVDDNPDCLSIFKNQGKPFGKVCQDYLSDEEYNAASLYVLLNCTEVDPYIYLFVDQMKVLYPNRTSSEISKMLDTKFTSWFAAYVRDPSNNVSNSYLLSLSKKLLRTARCFHGYYVNGYKFHTNNHGSNRLTMNSGVCIQGSSFGADENNWYGRLVDIVEIEYQGLPLKKTVLFKCE